MLLCNRIEDYPSFEYVLLKLTAEYTFQIVKFKYADMLWLSEYCVYVFPLLF